MDALSEVLSAVRLTGAIFLDNELRADWSYLTVPARKIADVLMPAADHVMPFHLVTEGACYARLLDGDPVELGAGDLVLLPAGEPHVLATASQAALRLKPVDLTGEGLLELLRRGEVTKMTAAGEGKTTRIICGFLACDRRLAEPILRGLPRLLKVSMRDDGMAAWVRSSMRLSVAESAVSRPGGAMVRARLAEVLFAEAVRRYVEKLPPGRSGWLAALRDRHIGKALALLHERPGEAWTVDSLAKSVGLSRSALGERFTAQIGVPPMQYLMRASCSPRNASKRATCRS